MIDVVVIGGGLLGASTARDAALRGLSVALFESDDFGAGATSHGARILGAGLRALETLDFTQVREQLHEREVLLQIASPLVVPLPCLIPFYDSNLLVQARLRASLALTDALGFDKSLPLHQILSAGEAREREPSLSPRGLGGAALVWEAAVPSPARLALEIALDAQAQGASLYTHTHVDGLRHRPAARQRESVEGVRWTNLLTGEQGETPAALVINASGASLPDVDRQVKGLAGVPSMRRKCVSVALPALRGGRDALLFPGEGDAGLRFAAPCPGFSLLGTLETDLVDQSPEGLYATGREVAALLHPVREYLPEADWGHPTLALAALRVSPPFPGPPALPDTFLPLVIDHAASGDGLGGLISAAGGSLLSSRSQAEEVVDLACRKLGRALSTPACRTAVLPLSIGAHSTPNITFHDESALAAEVQYSVKYEQCHTLNDFLIRRSSRFWSPDQGRSFVPAVLGQMAALLDWDPSRQATEVKAWEAEAALSQAFRVL